MSKTLYWHSLVTIYKSFVIPHLHHGDVINDQQIMKVLLQNLKEFNKMLHWQLQ